MIPKEFCDKYDACGDGAAFALQYGTMAEVWENCQPVNWLCWILQKMKIAENESEVRKFMCWVATETPLPDGRKTLDLLTDKRSRDAVEVALRFACNRANANELSAASAAARSAASAAAEFAASSAAWSAASAAASSAAWSAAAWSAAWSAASAAAESVASDAQWSAWSAAASAAAESAAWSAASSAQSIEFKKRFKNPFAG